MQAAIELAYLIGTRVKYSLTTSIETGCNIPVMQLVADVDDAAHMPRVLVLHGLLGAKHHWLPYMYLLASSGFNVYSIDLCLHGDWDDAATRDDMLTNNFTEAVRRIIYDSAKMVSALIDGWSTITTPIGLVGISAGGFVAHVLATEEKRFAAMVAVASSPDWTTADPDKVPSRFSPAYKFLESISPVNRPGKYPPLPLLMLNGTADMTVRHVGSIKLYEKLAPLYAKHGIADRVHLTLVDGLGHIFSDAMQAESIAWLKRFSDK